MMKEGVFEIDIYFGNILLSFERFLESKGINRDEFYLSRYQVDAEASWNELRNIAVTLQARVVSLEGEIVQNERL